MCYGHVDSRDKVYLVCMSTAKDNDRTIKYFWELQGKKSLRMMPAKCERVTVF